MRYRRFEFQKKNGMSLTYFPLWFFSVLMLSLSRVVLVWKISFIDCVINNYCQLIFLFTFLFCKYILSSYRTAIFCFLRFVLASDHCSSSQYELCNARSKMYSTIHYDSVWLAIMRFIIMMSEWTFIGIRVYESTAIHLYLIYLSSSSLRVVFFPRKSSWERQGFVSGDKTPEFRRMATRPVSNGAFSVISPPALGSSLFSFAPFLRPPLRPRWEPRAHLLPRWIQCEQ